MNILWYLRYNVFVLKAIVLLMFITRYSNIEAGSQFDCTEKRGEF
jgi:hypothetical protein